MQTDHIILFDGIERNHLLPLSATRAIADFRIGILTIREKWEKYFGLVSDVLTLPYLQTKYSYHQKDNSVFINATVLPDKRLIAEIEKLHQNAVLKDKDTVIAFKTDTPINTLEDLWLLDNLAIYTVNHDIQIRNTWDVFLLNGQEIINDIALLNLQPNSESLSKTNSLLGRENIYVEEGVQCEYAVLNASKGPIFLGKESEVMEGTTIRGAFSLGKHATLKMQSKIYGDTSIGPYCKVGGEVSNSVLFAFSNKAHDGFLGNAVIGEWCNLGADTNNSNLKNNYGNVSAWNYAAKDYINSGLQFLGLIMGDHSKSGINTMFNTGTVAGVGANIFGGGFPSKFIPDFSWGGAEGFQDFKLEKMFEVAERVMERRGVDFSVQDKAILTHIFEATKELRLEK